MKRFALDDLWVVAAWEPQPPRAPWRAITPVFAAGETADVVVWPLAVDVGRGVVHGHEEPRASLDAAIQEGRATGVGRAMRARREHALVRRADATFAVVWDTEVLRSRHAELRARLDRALDHLQQGSPLADIQDAFDGAFLVHGYDPVATILRAGAAARVRDQDPEWFSQCIEDLAYAEELGADLVEVRERLPWPQLGRAPLREALYRLGREALDDHLRPTTVLEPPVGVHAQAVAVATAIWRRQHFRTSRVSLPHALLTQVLAGDPAAVAAAEASLAAEPAWVDLCRVVESSWMLGGPAAVAPPDADLTGRAHAQITDMERFACSLHHLEQIEDGPARSARWRGFVQRTQGLSQQRDTRPWRQGELASEDLRSRLDLDGHPLPAVSALALTNGVFVGVAALSGGDIDGAASLPRNVPPCVFTDEVAAVDPRLSGRFALAHELGHLLLDRRRTGGNTWVCRTTPRQEDGGIVVDEERRANAFAAYLLAPREAVRNLVPSLPAVDSQSFVAAALAVRARFGLTPTTAAEHLLNCHHDSARDRLSRQVRGQVEDAARGAPVSGFEADLNLDAAHLPAGGSRTRRGRFAELIRRWVAVGELSPERAAEMLGVESSTLAPWLERAD